MAIAIDNSAKYTGTSFSYTTSGDNRVLIVGLLFEGAVTAVTGVTYGGVSLTRLEYQSSLNGFTVALYALLNPASGSNTISITTTSSYVLALVESFTGVGAIDGHNSGKTSAGTTNLTVTNYQSVSNCWLINVGAHVCTDAVVNIVSNYTERQNDYLAAENIQAMIADSNGTVGIGGVNTNFSSSTTRPTSIVGGLTLAIAPYSFTTTTKTITAKANIINFVNKTTTVTGKANISKNFSKTLTAKTNIKAIIRSTLNSKAKITATIIKTLITKANISKNIFKNLISKGDIKKTIGGVDIADYHSETNLYDDFYLGGDGDSSGWGQSFTGNGEILKNAKFYLKKYGNPTGNVTVKIFAHTGTFGVDGKPIGSALAISNMVLDVSSIPTSYTLINFDFSDINRITLENGTKYVLTIEYNSGIFPTDYIGVGMSNNNSHPGNPSYTADNLNWTGIDLNYDLIFYVYTDGITDLNTKANILINFSKNINSKASIKKLSIEKSITAKATIHKIFSTELIINNSAGNGYSNIASANWNGQGQSFLVGTDKLHLARIRHIGQWQWGYGPPITPTRLHCGVFTADINHLPVDLVATSYLSYETTDIERADGGHSPNYTTFDFWFTKGIELNPATQYVYLIVVEDVITDTILDGLTSSLNPYPNGRLVRLDNEFNLSSNISYDSWFEIYEYTESNQTLSAKGLIDTHKRYWVGGSGYWNGYDESHWSYTSGGTNNAPIPTSNDDIYFDINSGLTAESLIHPPGMVGGNCKDFICTTGTGFQIDDEGDIHIYGNIILESNLVFPVGNAPTFYLYGNDNQTITTNGASVYQFVVMCDGTYTLLDDLTLTAGLWGYSGTFDANNNNIISPQVYLAGDTLNPINIYMGSGTWELNSDSQPPWFIFGDSGNNIFCETSTIKITSNSASEKDFSGGNQTYNKVWFATSGIGEITIGGNNTFNELKIEPAQTVLFQAERTQTINIFDCVGTDGNLIILGSITPDTQFTLSKLDGIVNCDYLNISDSNATGGADWYAGEHSIDSGNNSGWIFTRSQNLTAKGQIVLLRIKTLTAKANIYPNIITSSTSISAKSRITINREETIITKTRIEKSNIKTLTSKSRIEINTNQTINSKGRITLTNNQNLISKARIQKSNNKNLESKARISISSEQSFLAKTRIEILNSQNILAKGRIVQTSLVSINSKSRITITSIQSISAKTDILINQIKTIQAKGRIQINNIQNIESKSNIFKNINQIITSKARINLITSTTINSKGSIQKEITQTVSAKSRITFNSISNILAKASIEKSILRTISSKADIKVTTRILEPYYLLNEDGSFVLNEDGTKIIISDPSLNAKASIFKGITNYITAKTDIEKTTNKIINAKARITQIETNLLESKANILNNQEKIITAKGRILGIFGQFIEGKTSIQKNTEQSILALTSIQKETNQTISSKGRIELFVNQEIIAQANILSNLEKIIQAKTRLEINTSQTINSKGRIKEEINNFITAKARINKLENQLIIAYGRIEKSIIQTLTSKAKIEGQIVYRIEAKACIVANKINKIEAKTRIQKITSQIINTKGNINFSTVQSINVKANIFINKTQIVQAKAEIETNNIQIIESKTNILKNISQIISSKARINLISEKTINSKAIISNYGIQILSTKSSIRKNIVCTLTAKSKIQILNSKFISSKANIVTSKIQDINVKGNIKNNITQLINVKAKIEINTLNTLIVKASIKNSVNRTLSSKAKLQTIKVTEIINQYREAEIAVDITYIKEIVKEVVYNKVKVKEIKNNFAKVEDIAYKKVEVIDVSLLKTIQIKWLTAKGNITK